MQTVKRLKAIQAVLLARYVDKQTNRLAIWPRWLSWRMLMTLEAHNLASHKHYSSLYSHTDYYITPIK